MNCNIQFIQQPVQPSRGAGEKYMYLHVYERAKYMHYGKVQQVGQLRAQVGFQKEELGKAYKEVYQDN